MGVTRTLAQTLFAVLCLLGIVAIAVGALLEVSRVRSGTSIITVRQLRLRVFSAVVWILILGSLASAVLWLWPRPGDVVQAHRFATVIGGDLILLVIAMLLLGYDLWQVTRARRSYEVRFNRQLSDMAQAEIQRVQQEHEAQRNGANQM